MIRGLRAWVRTVVTMAYAVGHISGGWALTQLWLFIVFPVVGAVIAGLVYRYLLEVPASARDKIEGPGEAAE